MGQTQNLTIVFTDIEGFTSRTSGLSRDHIDALLALNERITAEAVKEFGGSIVKNLGDGYMMTFESPTNAVLAAKKIQKDIAIHNAGVPQDDQFWVRVAANSGEVSVKEGDVFGEPVNVASRLMAQTESGDIAFTEAVYLAMNKTEIPSTPAGTKILRGIPEAVRVYRVPRFGEKAIPRGIAAGMPTEAEKKRSKYRKAGIAALGAAVMGILLLVGAMKFGILGSSQTEAQSDVLGVEESTGSAELANGFTNFFNKILGKTPTPTTRPNGSITNNGSSTGTTNTGGGSSTGTGNGTGGGSSIGGPTPTPTPCPGGTGNCKKLTPTPVVTCPSGQEWRGNQCRDIIVTNPTNAPAPTNTPVPAPTEPPATPTTPTCPAGEEWRGGQCKPINSGGQPQNQNNPNGNQQVLEKKSRLSQFVS